MIDVRIISETHNYEGKLDNYTALVYIKDGSGFKVETVQNLVSKSYVLQIDEIPEIEAVNFN